MPVLLGSIIVQLGVYHSLRPKLLKERIETMQKRTHSENTRTLAQFMARVLQMIALLVAIGGIILWADGQIGMLAPILAGATAVIVLTASVFIRKSGN